MVAESNLHLAESTLTILDTCNRGPSGTIKGLYHKFVLIFQKLSEANYQLTVDWEWEISRTQGHCWAATLKWQSLPDSLLTKLYIEHRDHDDQKKNNRILGQSFLTVDQLGHQSQKVPCSCFPKLETRIHVSI